MNAHSTIARVVEDEIVRHWFDYRKHLCSCGWKPENVTGKGGVAFEILQSQHIRHVAGFVADRLTISSTYKKAA